MATHTATRAPRALPPKTRPVPPLLDGRGTAGAALVLVVEPDAARRERIASALATIPARIVSLPNHAEAYIAAHEEAVAVVVVDGREAPGAAVDFVKHLHETQPFVVPVMAGLEGEPHALLAAVNEAGAFRVLPENATDRELRGAVLAALAHERERRFHARLDRGWVRGLLGKIESAIPAASLVDLDARGGELPVDLVLRPGAGHRPRGASAG